MGPVNIHDAKTRFSRLVDAAARGEEIIIAKAGKPVAKLGPLGPVLRPKRLGLLAGHFALPEDFDAPLPDDVLATFEGAG